MSIKIFLISFITISILLYLLSIPIQITRINPNKTLILPNISKNPYPVSFAYLISASSGDVGKMKRLLMAIYHPGNHYLVHLDSGAEKEEHEEIARFVSEGVFGRVGNVMVVGKANLVTYRGPTMLATTLHAMAMLLKTAKEWDWFINLSASDYPLITQDDMISAFADIPRHLNFVQHTSHLGWKLNKRGKPIIIDPGLYSNNKSEIRWVVKQRSLPTSFKLYTGSAWTIISRSFAEYCILGYENLPRTLLLYYTNFISSPEGYFQTVICNSQQYKNTTINHEFHYISWDNPPKQHPRLLGMKDYRRMIFSNRPFARKFKEDDKVLDKIDRELLKRTPQGFSYGGWCSEDSGINGSDSDQQCNDLVRFGVLKSGAGGRRLQNLLTKLVSGQKYSNKRQCR